LDDASAPFTGRAAIGYARGAVVAFSAHHPGRVIQSAFGGVVDLVVPARFDDFEVVGPLGSGGMGAVFLGHDRMLDRPVALKFMAPGDGDAGAHERFLQEARAIARLHHPNVASVYRISTVDGRPYIAYEFVDGIPLTKLVRPAEWRRVLDIAIGVARGLAAVHDAGVVHRDIKPGNVIVGPNRVVKLIDFGLAEPLERGTPDDTLRGGGPGDLDARRRAPAQPFVFAGTPLYVAPELWLGEPPSARSDIYALGLLLWELLAGELPQPYEDEADAPAAMAARTLPSIGRVRADVPHVLAELIDRCVARVSHERPRTAGELRDHLEMILGLYAPLGGISANDADPSKGADKLASSLSRATAGGQFAARFYERLFGEAPAIRALFPVDLSEQQRKLVDVLFTAVSAARSPEQVAALLEDLGARHHAAGVRPEHFQLVGRVLLATLAELDAVYWTRALAALWERAYGRVAAHMLRGLARAAHPSQPTPAPNLASDPTPSAPRYTHSEPPAIAYQIIGDGPRDLVIMPTWISHLELNWQDPGYAAFVRRLAQRSRVILFDTRGTGLSERTAEGLDVDHFVSDLVEVLDAAGVDRAVLVALGSTQTATATMMAATHPERVRALVYFGGSPCMLARPDYPDGISSGALGEMLEAIRSHWGEPIFLDLLAPSRVHDATFAEWWARLLRSCTSPSTLTALFRSSAALDVRAALPAVRAPTLVVHRRDNRLVSVRNAHTIAAAVPGARLVELPGEDVLVNAGDTDAVASEIDAFIGDLPTAAQEPMRLVTVLAARSTDADSSVRLRRAITTERGFEAEDARGITAVFDSPAAALRALQHATVGSNVAAGLHVAIVPTRLAGDAGAATTAWSLATSASPGEVRLSATANALVGDARGLRSRDLAADGVVAIDLA
jgi:eukaryotic-like serine/threonine-protein kinase